MQKKSLLIAVAVAGFIVALIVGLPARVLVYVLPSSVTAGMLSGSVWNGSAQYLTIGGRTWGPVKWQVHPLSLLAGKLTLDGELGSGDSQIRGRFSAELGGAIEGRKVEMRWPLSGFTVAILGFSLVALAVLIAPDLRLSRVDGLGGLAAFGLYMLPWLFIPTTVAYAMRRHRLWTT